MADEMENGGMNNMVVHATDPETMKPIGRPLYSGTEVSCRSWAQQNGGRMMTPADSDALIAKLEAPAE